MNFAGERLHPQAAAFALALMVQSICYTALHPSGANPHIAELSYGLGMLGCGALGAQSLPWWVKRPARPQGPGAYLAMMGLLMFALASALQLFN